MKSKIYVYGHRGRIGSIVVHYLRTFNLSITDEPLDALIWILAIPVRVVPEILSEQGERWVIDMSGYSKRYQIGGYGEAGIDSSHRVIQNVGCFASSVIQAFRLSLLL